MNIFYLSHDPTESARWHCDRHVLKMPIESLQLMFSVHWRVAGIRKKIEKELLGEGWKEVFPNLPRESPYGIGYQNHGCTKWVLASADNYRWLSVLAEELLLEYERRWPGREHSCKKLARWAAEHVPDLPEIGLTTPYLAMPDSIKSDDPVESYRRYYHRKMIYMRVTWKGRSAPPWWHPEKIS